MDRQAHTAVDFVLGSNLCVFATDGFPLGFHIESLCQLTEETRGLHTISNSNLLAIAEVDDILTFLVVSNVFAHTKDAVFCEISHIPQHRLHEHNDTLIRSIVITTPLELVYVEDVAKTLPQSVCEAVRVFKEIIHQTGDLLLAALISETLFKNEFITKQLGEIQVLVVLPEAKEMVYGTITMPSDITSVISTIGIKQVKIICHKHFSLTFYIYYIIILL